MNSEPDEWSPSPELLAAYFDGELVGRPEQIDLRRRIARWLRSHPEARAVLDDYRRIAHLWHDTTPPEPEPAVWQRLDAQLASIPLARSSPARRQWVRWTTALVTVAAAIGLAVWLARPDALQLARAPEKQITAPPDTVEVFPVATAGEVTILRVEGDDTQTLVVGELPLHGPLELAGPGEVALTSVQPDARDRMRPLVRMGDAQRPMIWARVDAEAMEP